MKCNKLQNVNYYQQFLISREVYQHENLWGLDSYEHKEQSTIDNQKYPSPPNIQKLVSVKDIETVGFEAKSPSKSNSKIRNFNNYVFSVFRTQDSNKKSNSPNKKLKRVCSYRNNFDSKEGYSFPKMLKPSLNKNKSKCVLTPREASDAVKKFKSIVKKKHMKI